MRQGKEQDALSRSQASLESPVLKYKHCLFIKVYLRITVKLERAKKHKYDTNFVSTVAVEIFFSELNLKMLVLTSKALHDLAVDYYKDQFTSTSPSQPCLQHYKLQICL